MTCELCGKSPVCIVTDAYGSAVFCRSHTNTYEVHQRSVGRTIFGFLRWYREFHATFVEPEPEARIELTV